MRSPAKASAPEVSAGSFLDVVGKSILESASSIDAHIDADSLVKQAAAAVRPAAGSAGRARLKDCASRFKELAKRSPGAIAAARGAVQALVGMVERLSPAEGGDELDDDDAAAEALQDTLETLSLLIGDASRDQDFDELRASEVARLVVNCSQNGKQLLRLLSARDVSTRYDTMVLLQRVYLRQAAPINAALLADPMALTHLMRVLQESPIDYVRNECLSLLLLLTASESEIQTIVTVQGLVETVFNILEEEDLAAGGKVARDLLRVLCNLLGNATCQRYVREAGGMSSLVAAMAMAISGRPAEDGPEGGPVDEDDVLLAQMADMVPEESRWACLGLLADAALLLAGSQAEATANQQALVRAGALGLCRHVLDGQPGGPPRTSQAMALAAKLRLVHLLEALEASPLAARALAAYGEEEPPLLFLLTRAVVGPGVPLGLRSAVGRVLGRTLARHAELQSLVCSSLSPQLEQEPGASAAPAGRQVVEVLEAAAAERPDGVRLWFSLHLLLAMLHGNEAVQTACGSLPVAVPGEEDAGPAETLLALLMRVFPACARACSAAAAVAEADGAPVPGPESVRELGPQSPAAGLLAVMKVLAYWMSRCSAPLQLFASSPVAMPAAIELTTFSEQLGAFFKLQVEGLAGVLMGVCIKAEQGEVDVKSLMAFVARKVGIEEFEQKVERLWRSEALQKPPRGLAEFRWYGGRYREFVRETQQAVKRRMVQLYVAEGVGGGASALSEDVADHYKQLIRVQDSELREVRKENEGLRSEVEAFMRRALQASSAALAEKTAALQEENAALHAELDQLTEEAEVQAQRSRRERDRSNARIHELEQQLRSMALGYEQVERTSEALQRERAELRAALAAARGAAPGAGAAGTAAERLAELELQAASARQRVDELQRERGDLLDLLGRLAATLGPQAAQLVAPLGAPVAASTLGAA